MYLNMHVQKKSHVDMQKMSCQDENHMSTCKSHVNMQHLFLMVRRQSMLFESLIRSGGADRYADADTTALAEVAPLTLPRPAAPDTRSVRRDLEEELMAVAADSRPP